MNSSSLWRAFVGLLVLLVTAVAASPLFSSVERSDTAPPGSDTSRAEWKAIRLAPATAPNERWSRLHPARLRFNEASAARVSSPVPGRVEEAFVELGARVKAGDKLFSISSRDVAALRAEQRRAMAELEAAQTAHQRIAAMVAARAVPAAAEIEASARVRHAELSSTLAKTKLMAIGASGAAGARFTVVAPRDGVVVHKSALPSQPVTPPETLIEIADVRSLGAVADVFEADIGRIEAGATVRLTCPSLPDWSMVTTVQSVAPVVDARRHTVSVRALGPNPDSSLRSNTYVEMSVLERVPERSVEVPVSAVASDGYGDYVYLASDAGRFVRRLVQAGSSYLGQVLVTDGLLVGDLVVEHGVALLDNDLIHDEGLHPTEAASDWQMRRLD